MRELREFYSDVIDCDENKLILRGPNLISRIGDKLLTLDDGNKKLYCRIIVNFTWEFLSVTEEFSEVFTGEDLENLNARVFDSEVPGISLLYSFFCDLSNLFYLCGISLYDTCLELEFPPLLPDRNIKLYDYKEREKSKFDITKKTSVTKKNAGAKVTEQADVVRTLLNSAGVKYNSDSNLADFISWLCGGSSETIRQRGLSQNTGFDNEETLKKKFSMIGIEYSRGKLINKEMIDSGLKL